MKRQRRHPLIKAKIQVFDELMIPWDSEIESRFNAELAKGERHAEIFLDNLCREYINYFYDHYEELLLAKIREKYGNVEAIYDFAIKKLIGKEGLQDLINANLIECCGSYDGHKLYAI